MFEIMAGVYLVWASYRTAGEMKRTGAPILSDVCIRGLLELLFGTILIVEHVAVR